MLLHHVDSWRDSGPKSRKKNFGSSFRSLAMFHFPPSFPPRLSPHKGLQPEVSSVLQSGFWEVVFNPSKHTTRVSDGGWRVTDGGWWATHGGWRVTFSVTEGLVCVFCSPCRRPRAVVVDQRGPREGNPPNPPNSPSRPLTAPRIDTHTHPFAHVLTPWHPTLIRMHVYCPDTPSTPSTFLSPGHSLIEKEKSGGQALSHIWAVTVGGWVKPQGGWRATEGGWVVTDGVWRVLHGGRAMVLGATRVPTGAAEDGPLA